MIKVRGALRCAYCHDEARGLLDACDGCGVVLHAECRARLRRCTTIGCRSTPATIAPALAAPPALLPLLWERLGPWLKRGVVTAALFGPCVWFSLAVRVQASPHAVSRSRAHVLRTACASYYADHRRWPRSLDELRERGERGPYLDEYPPVFEDYHLVARGRVVWIAVEVRGERYETLRLVEPLYELAEGAIAPTTSGTLLPRDY